MKLLVVVCVITIACSAFGQSASDTTPQSEELFVRRIAPLLREKCNGCHGNEANKIEGSLNLTSLSGAQAGGDSGEAAIVPKKPDKSPLYLAVGRKHDEWSAMPPKEAEKLTTEQLSWIHKWIELGASWPDPTREKEIAKRFLEAWSAEDGVLVATSGGLSDEWTNRKYKRDALWAYQAVRKPDLPASALSPIDHLIKARMPDQLNVSPRADRRTLIRRASFDLIGLPPTNEQIEEFLADTQSDEAAFAALVNRLLESPHYGERMAQHWLDVVRYADSSGFANDYERGNAWRYRDYVVRSFNMDKPFDQFAVEQIAGDELDDNDPEKIIATGFLRMGPWELTGMEVPRVARQRFLDDVTNSVGETFLAHSLQCARCHDHKFDPVPTRDYYAIQAVFATTQLADRSAAFLAEENCAGFEERKYLEQRREHFEQELKKLDEVLLANAEQWFVDRGLPTDQWNAAVARAKESPSEKGSIFNAARRVFMNNGADENSFPPKLVGFTPTQFGLERVARKGLERLAWEFNRYEPIALSVYAGRTPSLKNVYAPLKIPARPMDNGELEETCILAGGDPFTTAASVTPNVLTALESTAGVKAPQIPSDIEGRRLAFAKWVTDSKNPLTSRAIANRVWMWHFNEPLAGNPNNFGSTGKLPTHPELLDWLTATLVEEGWSIKSLHRHIMNSATYCRSSLHPDPAQLSQLDPLSQSYASFKPHRLTAEEIRDAMLFVTGELNTKLGGIPCRPEINEEVALQPRQVMGTFASAFLPNPLPQQRHRRSLYALKLRGVADPMLQVFNTPTPDFSCERRDASTVTPQVFSLFNSRSSHTRALALANRASLQEASDEKVIATCFQFAYGRQPERDELTVCLDAWKRIEQQLPEFAPNYSKPPTSIVREAVEENTGEHFAFEESLYSNVDFVPDLQAHQVTRHLRALADVCLALFNSNEFVYVY